ncbi:hypothetical protein [Sulfobacillus harzensis]|uniref:Uncharacterized protein n=1 Tax=Sulfobacillus harzensis TaxID=2729629 RepID=A0A7Y0L6H8_9FIRM|nr:hypothetical protein [Sulfobacillus harzensis]NMP23340.1 hypothetical protein [Sulfobacillus harzensis]
MLWRRARTPWWVWVLAIIGMKSLWVRRQEAVDPGFRAKQERFREKVNEAFAVWRDDHPTE